VTAAFVLFLVAAVWAVLPAFVDLKLGFPHASITVGAAGLAWLLTLLAWIESFDGEFSIWALLGFLTATAILAFAVLALASGMRSRPVPAGGSVGAESGADQPAVEPGQQHGQFQQPSGQQPYGQPPSGQQSSVQQPYGHQPYGQGSHEHPAPPYGRPSPPEQPTQPPPPGAAPSSGGSTASGEGSSTQGSGERPTA
jgi:hypothetical protein